MRNILIESIPGYQEWRDAARECLLLNIHPANINWNTKTTIQNDLFTDKNLNNIKPPNTSSINVPKAFFELAEDAICHKDDGRFDILYRVLWRITYENKNLLRLKTDNDILKLTHLVKEVRRDAYKITAFLRFRSVEHNGEEHFIAWYQPEHYILELKLHFFNTRFKNMRWSILTPYRAAHWDGENLELEDNPDPNLYPKDDDIEKYWLTYYANIFNPARPKKNAMLSQMPKKYWKNMPETNLIADLLKTSESRAKSMINNSGTS